MKKKNTFFKPLTTLLRRFHLMLFFIFVVACLAGGVIFINRSVDEGQTESSGYTSSISAGSIDQTTLQRLQTLKPSDDTSSPFEPPEGRINPFGE